MSLYPWVIKCLQKNVELFDHDVSVMLRHTHMYTRIQQCNYIESHDTILTLQLLTYCD